MWEPGTNEKYFPKTTSSYENYLLTIDSLYRDPESSYHVLEIEHPAVKNALEIFNQTFVEEYSELIISGEYFYGCPIDIYEKTYSSRLLKFKTEMPVAEDYDFIVAELKEGIFKLPEGFSLLDYAYIVKLQVNLRARFGFLQNRLSTSNFIELNADDTFEIRCYTHLEAEPEFPYFFTSQDAYQCFLIYLNGCTRDLQEISYLKKRLQSDGYIHQITDINFIEWLNDVGHLTSDEFTALYEAGQLNSLYRSSTDSRIVRYNAIFSNISSD